MSQPYVGEIICVGFNFVPSGYLACDGSLVDIAQYDVLFNLIGTTYGGDGQTTFAVPDLRGRVAIHEGQSSNSSNYVLGQNGGVEGVTITSQTYPNHTHPLEATNNVGTAQTPTNNVLAQNASPTVYGSAAPATALNNLACSQAPGSNLPHENMQPYQVLNWVISPFGVFPSQT